MAVEVNWVRGFSAVMAVGIALSLGGCGAMVGTSGFSDEDRYNESVDEGVMRRIMEGIGGVDPRREPIRYKPRSPLAVPPSSELPPPEDGNATTAAAGQWPVSPEQRDRQMLIEGFEKESARRDSRAGERLSHDELQEGALTPEMAQSARARRPYNRDVDTMEQSGRRLTPAEMKGQKAVLPSDAKNLDENGVPVRKYLIEPPSEYRKPSPEAPLALPENKHENWFTKLF